MGCSDALFLQFPALRRDHNPHDACIRPLVQLVLGDISVDCCKCPLIIVVRLKGSKTERQGVSVTVGHTGDILSPVETMVVIPQTPCSSSRMVLLWFVHILKEAVAELALSIGLYSGHSFSLMIVSYNFKKFGKRRIYYYIQSHPHLFMEITYTELQVH